MRPLMSVRRLTHDRAGTVVFSQLVGGSRPQLTPPILNHAPVGFFHPDTRCKTSNKVLHVVSITLCLSQIENISLLFRPRTSQDISSTNKSHIGKRPWATFRTYQWRLIASLRGGKAGARSWTSVRGKGNIELTLTIRTNEANQILQ